MICGISRHPKHTKGLFCIGVFGNQQHARTYVHICIICRYVGDRQPVRMERYRMRHVQRIACVAKTYTDRLTGVACCCQAPKRSSVCKNRIAQSRRMRQFVCHDHHANDDDDDDDLFD